MAFYFLQQSLLGVNFFLLSHTFAHFSGPLNLNSFDLRSLDQAENSFHLPFQIGKKKYIYIYIKDSIEIGSICVLLFRVSVKVGG